MTTQNFLSSFYLSVFIPQKKLCYQQMGSYSIFIILFPASFSKIWLLRNQKSGVFRRQFRPIRSCAKAEHTIGNKIYSRRRLSFQNFYILCKNQDNLHLLLAIWLQSQPVLCNYFKDELSIFKQSLALDQISLCKLRS